MALFKLSLLVLAKLCKLVAKLGASDIDALIVDRPFDDPVISDSLDLVQPFSQFNSHSESECVCSQFCLILILRRQT